MAKKNNWHLMTWREIGAACKDNPTVLIPAGTTETQGPMTYVGFEFVLPQRLAEEVAQRTNALVAPTIPFGYSPDFQDFPGTILLRPEVLSALYEDVVRSLLRHGFDHLLFLATHKPNQPMLEEVAYKIREELGVLIGWVNPGVLASVYLKDVSPNIAEAKGHGADPALSLGKYLEPDAIDLSSAVQNAYLEQYQGVDFAGGSSLSFNGFTFNMPLKLQDLSPETGGFGNTSFASEDQGKRIFLRMVDYITELVEQFAKIDTRLAGQ